MKILFDIGHPAHVHYFKNLIKTLPSEKILVVARNKEVTFELLKNLDIAFISRGKGGKGVVSKILYMIWADIFILIQAIKFKPDVFISFSTIYPSHVAFLLRKKYIGITDTEHSVEQIKLFKPFSYKILTPTCFLKDLGPKQIRFPSYMELAYLHPSYFEPDLKVLDELGLKVNEKYAIIRFVSWEASHDTNQKGFSLAYKRELVNSISKKCRVLISSEKPLEDEFEKYRFKIPAHKFHSALAFATLYVGEGGTTASECAVLGVPNIFVNSLIVGYCKEQEEKYGLCYNYRNQQGVLEKCLEILSDPNIKEEFKVKRSVMLKDKIPLTDYLIDFISKLKK